MAISQSTARHLSTTCRFTWNDIYVAVNMVGNHPNCDELLLGRECTSAHLAETLVKMALFMKYPCMVDMAIQIVNTPKEQLRKRNNG